LFFLELLTYGFDVFKLANFMCYKLQLHDIDNSG